MSNTGKYKLYYFNIQGRGEVHRLVFHYLGIDFEDKTITFDEWPQHKNDKIEVPCGNLPVLTVPSGEKLVQTASILRYLGNEFGLYGKNNIEKARIDAILDFNKEIYDAYVKAQYYTPDPKEKSERLADLEKLVNQAFTYYETVIKENAESSYFVGEKPSIADIYFLEVINGLKDCMPDNQYLSQYPLLQKLYNDTVNSSSTLRHYLNERNK